jgi:hypothetical protein
MIKVLKQFVLCLMFIVLFSHSVGALWVKTNVSYGGRVRSFAVSSGNIFAGTGCDYASILFAEKP